MALPDRAPGDGVRQALITGVMLGIGVMGALDEVVFHQLLQWHNFYVHTTEYWRIFSDGLFHAFTAAVLFAGALRLWSRRRSIGSLSGARPLAAGILLGMGGFQVFDGIVSHKVLQIHPVREGVDNVLPYDLAWNGFGGLLLVAGWLVWRAVPRRGATDAGRQPDRPVGRRR